MPPSLSRLRRMAERPAAQKMIRYSLVSVLCIIVAQVVLFVLQVAFSMNEGLANLVAFAISTVPSYQLNRRWAWGKSGRGHLWKELVPFWALSFLGFAFSESAVVAAGGWARRHHLSQVGRSGVVNVSALAALGVLWIVKFAVFNRVLFRSHDAGLEPALDGHP